MAKKLIEKETINKVYKAIEVHLQVLRESDIYLKKSQQDRFTKSVEYLEGMLLLLKPIDEEFKELKREAYINYKNAKEKVKKYKIETKNINEEELKKLEHEEEQRLKIYLLYKDSEQQRG